MEICANLAGHILARKMNLNDQLTLSHSNSCFDSANPAEMVKPYSSNNTPPNSLQAISCATQDIVELSITLVEWPNTK
jgi:hypothetical protein